MLSLDAGAAAALAAASHAAAKRGLRLRKARLAAHAGVAGREGDTALGGEGDNEKDRTTRRPFARAARLEWAGKQLHQ